MLACISPSTFAKKKEKKAHFGSPIERQLVARDLLVSMAKLSLKERVGVINRMFPNQVMSVTRLRRIYANNGVRYKLVKARRCWRRPDDTKNLAKDEVILKSLKSRIDSITAADREVIFLDEVLLSGKHFKRNAWMGRGSNAVVTRTTTLDEGCVALLAAISRERGIISFTFRKKSIKQDDFISFLHDLRLCSGNQRLHVVLDNCAVHHSRSVLRSAEQTDIELLWLKPYSPHLNAIELLWASVKQSFGKELLEAHIQATKPVFIRELVVPILEAVSRKFVTAICDKALRQIREEKV